MRLIAISDIHSNFQMLENLVERERGDFLLVAGDITHFSPDGVHIFEEIVSDFSGEVIAVHGNCDFFDAFRYRKLKFEFIHGKTVVKNGIHFHGLGGSPKTPFNTPSEYSESHYNELINGFIFGDFNVLVSHSPPYGILDKTSFGINAGNKVLREYISRFDIIVCGHIHESSGIQRVGETVVVNTGPLSSGYYAIINISDVPEVKLERLV